MAYQYLSGDGDGQYAIPRWARGPGGHQGQYVDPSKASSGACCASCATSHGACGQTSGGSVTARSGLVATPALRAPEVFDPAHPTRVTSLPPAGAGPSRIPILLVLVGAAVLGVIVVRKVRQRP